MTIEWKLPKPEKRGNRFIWKPVVRDSKISTPWGYDKSKDDPDILIPNEEQLELLEQGKKYLKTYSYREVAEWLSERTGRPITVSGLFNRIKNEQKSRRSAKISRFYAEKYKKLQEKAERLEARIGGKKIRIPKNGGDP